MATDDILTRDDNAWDINTGTEAVPVWTPILNLNNWAPSPGNSTADTTVKESAGWDEHSVSRRTMEHTISGLKLVDAATGARDPGQAATEALAFGFGPESKTKFRHTAAGSVVNVFKASAVVTQGGGGVDDASAWEAKLKMSGPPTFTGTPDLPSVVTAVTGTGGVGFATITWTNGARVGTLFEVRVFDNTDTLVTSVLSSAKPVHVVLVAATGYTAEVRAQNDSGWSALSAASSAFTVT